MILKNIFYKFGYIEKSEFDKLEEVLEKYIRVCGVEKKEKENAIEARDNCLKINEELANENDRLREREAELKALLCDEIQKRFELIKLLAESEIVIKEPEVESEEARIWKDAKKDPPKNMKEVAIYSETGLDIGYYTEKFGWVRKDGIVIKAKYWRELSEPDASEAKGE